MSTRIENGKGLGEIDSLFADIRARIAEAGPAGAEPLLAHLRSLARWHREPLDYVDPGPVAFPASLPVAYAVCHPECGTAEFIVEGSTQECQHCGGSLFRMETRHYALSDQPT